MLKRQVAAAMKKHEIAGELTGSGERWAVVLPDEESMQKFCKNVVQVGGFCTGYGAWHLRPGYQSMGDPGDPSSRWHY